ncbi:MAG TPA: hypothetical protein VGH28_06125 [Polyangiaceae bacterium]|jgi:hypothetical protein
MKRLSLFWVCAALAGCAASPAVSAARRGDNAAVARAIEPELRAGRLGNDDAAAIARAVAEHAISGGDAQERVRELRTCASALASELEDRMKTHDAAGAEAAMALYEIDELSAGAAREWLRDPSDDWRAVGTRGLVREEDAAARQKALLDPSVKVRRASMRASAEAKATADVPALLEAARVDPDLMARTEAVRAIGRIDPPSSDVVRRLHDLWTSSDDALREDIAHAWIAPHLASAGGAEEIRMLLAAGHGPGAVSAAALVAMGARTADGKTSFDDDTKKSAIATLVRAIDRAPRRERMLALAMSPLSNPELRDAVNRATGEANDLETRESAWSRLLEVPAEHDAAKKALFAFASPESPESLARRARMALAADGEISVQAWIEADLKSSDPTTKLLAASALASLHRAARAAPLLADPDAHVRTAAACTVLAAR